MVKVDGLDLNITEELKEVLRKNQQKVVRKPVIDKKRNSSGDLVQKTDEDGNLMFQEAVIDTHPFVYFDAFGNFYFRVFRSLILDGKEVLVTNPNIKTKPDCVLYGRGLISHRQPIEGSDLWDNGSDLNMKHSEIIHKGDPLSKIVKKMTSKEVLDVNLKPTGNSIAANIANSTDAEKIVMVEQLFGADFAKQMKDLVEKKSL